MDIILIDDNDDFRVGATAMLTDAGHEVTPVRTGQQALRLLRVMKTDLLITDLVMPREQGLDLMINIRAEFPNLAIIAMSEHAAQSAFYERLAAKLGVLTCLFKPFALEELMAAVRSVGAGTRSDLRAEARKEIP